jgi:phage tail sheath protein FI
MNDQLLSSKMVVQEQDSGVRGIPGVPTTVCGAIGIAERGPIGKATLCQGLPDYQNRFGRILPNSDLSQAAMGFFLNAGGNGSLWVVRTVHYDDVSDPTTAKAVRATGWLSAVVPVPATAVAANAAPYALNDGDELAVSVKGGPDQVITFHGSAAWVVAGGVGPYALVDGQTLDVLVDEAAAPIEVTFSAKAFANIGAATAPEVVAVLAATLHGTTCDLSGAAPRITSATRGTASGITVTGGAAAAALRFPQGRAPGGGNVPNLGAVQLADIQPLVAALSGVALAAGATALSLQAVDPTATLQVRPATSGAFGFDPAVHAPTSQTVAKAVRIHGADPGSYADALQMVVQTGRTGVDVLTVENGTTRDRFTNVSLDPASPRYIETLVNNTKTGSMLVRAKDQHVAAAGATLAIQTAPLSGGDDGLTGLMDVDFLGSATGKTGLQALNTVQDLAMLIVPGRATSGVHNGMIDYCEIDRSGAVFPILATPAGMSAQDIVTYVSQDAQLEERSEFGAIFWPRIQVLNPSSAYFGNVDTVIMDPSGFIAGLFALNDSSTPGGIYQASAGTESGILAGVVGFETDECMDEDARDLVYPHRINPLTTAPGQPFYVDGCYTLKSDGDFPFIPQRRGVIFIERSLKTGLDWVRHKNNTRALRQRVYRTSYAFLYAQMTNGAFASTTPKTAFVIDVSDGAGGLNTPEVIASGQLLANYGLAMNTPAEWGIITVTKDTRALDTQAATSTPSS